ncbi:MAG: hypothetical protein B7Y02_05480 [Rhodobacterales bacterium 17-64-5]|nr:MAG: hypothetical protein B7Y02_05480 [Rhodobacterales bacterium 17-64-5]
MTLVVEWGIAAVLVGGGLFALIGSYGLLRLPQAMQRLHAPTKATTIGVGAALLASSLGDLPGGGAFSAQEWLVAAFLLLTAPISALFLAKTLILRGEAGDTLPDTRTGRPWATLEQSPPEPSPEPPIPDHPVK